MLRLSILKELKLVSDQTVTCCEVVWAFLGSVQEQAAHKFILQSERRVCRLERPDIILLSDKLRTEPTPLHGPSKSCFKYLFSSEILLLWLNDILNQPGNL